MSAIDYSHQDTGAAFLAERRFALLADDPGLGKSFSAIKAADLLDIRRILIICPGAVRRHWEAELDLRQTIDRPITVEEGFLTAPPGAGVTIVSHATLSDLGRKGRMGSISWLNAGAPYDLIIVDESHEMRHYQASRTRTLLGPDGIASQARHVWLLSGTPVVNSAADLYPLVFGALRLQVSWLDFCTHYCEMRTDAFNGLKPVGIRNAAELADGLRPYVLRRTIASLGIDLPPLDIQRRTLAVDPAAVASAMAGIEDWSPERLLLAIGDGDELRDAAMSRVRRALGLAKAEAAAAHVEAILAAGDGPVVAFFQHTDVRIAMHAALTRAGRVCSWIDGKVTAKQLRAAREWHQAGRLDVLLVQTAAGGVGLTLTRGHRVAICELPWTASSLFQAIKRVHRIGQTRACLAEVLSAQGCWLDEVLATVVETKRKASDELLDLLTSSA
jgi:SWI/SNF-related matrix-associated actin-dependent regulator 1 of chromatin subfamily A